jgi:hypothetical protein
MLSHKVKEKIPEFLINLRCILQQSQVNIHNFAIFNSSLPFFHGKEFYIPPKYKMGL